MINCEKMKEIIHIIKRCVMYIFCIIVVICCIMVDNENINLLVRDIMANIIMLACVVVPILLIVNFIKSRKE